METSLKSDVLPVSIVYWYEQLHLKCMPLWLSSEINHLYCLRKDLWQTSHFPGTLWWYSSYKDSNSLMYMNTVRVCMSDGLLVQRPKICKTPQKKRWERIVRSPSGNQALQKRSRIAKRLLKTPPPTLPALPPLQNTTGLLLIISFYTIFTSS